MAFINRLTNKGRYYEKYKHTGNNNVFSVNPWFLDNTIFNNIEVNYERKDK